MIVTYKNIQKYTFPVFILPSDNWEYRDGLFFVDGVLTDDRNMPGDSLGLRRLQTPFKPLLRLSRAAYDLRSLIKSGSKFFIDSNGDPFQYEKTRFMQVKYYPIRKVDRKEIASVLWLQGIRAPFTIPRPPPDDISWAGVLLLENKLPWILYEYSVVKKPNSRRKV